MNYTELSAAIKAYTENTFPDTLDSEGMTSDEQVALFVRQAEQRIFNTVQFLDVRKDGTITCTPNSPFVDVPEDWLADYSLALIDPDTGAYSFLLNKDVSFIRESFPTPTDTGTPLYYAYNDDTKFIIGPTPDDNYELAVNYFYYPESIVDAGTSWLGDNFDSVLLYGALLEANTYMKGEQDVMAEYQKRYDEAVAMAKQLAEGKNRQDNYRTMQARYPVR